MNNHCYKCQSKAFTESSAPWFHLSRFSLWFSVLPSHLAPKTEANAWSVLCFLDQLYHLLEKNWMGFFPLWGRIKVTLVFSTTLVYTSGEHWVAIRL